MAHLLELALTVSRAERAFVVTPGPVVAAFCSRRADGERRPSWTVLEAALGGEGPFLCLDACDDQRLAAGRSIRELALTSVVAAPIHADGQAAGALVLDSRHVPDRNSDRLLEIARAFASVVGVLAGFTEESPATPEWSVHHRSAQDWIVRVARTELPVLIQGETGSGKEQVARTIHAGSARADGPFQAVNCAALTESLLEAELFGAVRGAYTGASRDRAGLFRGAHGGTLFLDEVGDMPGAMQAKLLRVLEQGRVRPVGDEDEHPVDVRIVAATHRDLAACVEHGHMRADLYYRLAVLEVRVPPLRERTDDLPRLVRELSSRIERETGLGPLRLSTDTWPILRSRRWPGNVRELHTVLARALIRSDGRCIGPEHLDPLPPTAGSAADGSELAMLRRAITEAGGNLTRAAARIGWTRQKLARRMAALGLTREMRCSIATDEGYPESPEGRTSSDSSTFQ